MTSSNGTYPFPSGSMTSKRTARTPRRLSSKWSSWTATFLWSRIYERHSDGDSVETLQTL